MWDHPDAGQEFSIVFPSDIRAKEKGYWCDGDIIVDGAWTETGWSWWKSSVQLWWVEKHTNLRPVGLWSGFNTSTAAWGCSRQRLTSTQVWSDLDLDLNEDPSDFSLSQPLFILISCHIFPPLMCPGCRGLWERLIIERQRSCRSWPLFQSAPVIANILPHRLFLNIGCC